MKPVALAILLLLTVTLYPGSARTASGAAEPLADITAHLAAGRYSEAAAAGDAALKTTALPSSLRINIACITAQAHSKAGNPDQALKLLETTRAVTKPAGADLSRLLQISALAALSGGDSAAAERSIDEAVALEGLSPLDQARQFYIKGMIARQAGDRDAEADRLLSLSGETAALLKPAVLMPAIMLQRGKLAEQSGDGPSASKYYQAAIGATEQVNPDDDLINILAEAGWALHQANRAGAGAENAAAAGSARQAMLRAAELSLQSGNQRARATSLLKAGTAAENEADFAAALTAAMDAINSAQQGRHADLLPACQHLAARVLSKMGRKDSSLAMYRGAARNLEYSKNGILPNCSKTTAQYQETVRPVYQELAELLLQEADIQGAGAGQQGLLLEARKTLDMLRTEELRDYFGDACLGSGSMVTMQGTSPPGTAVIYSVFFPERLELLVSLPDGMKRIRVERSPGDIGRDARLLRLTIENRFQNWEAPARNLYDSIIRPLDRELVRQKISRLIFVPDGPLRNIPLSVLHDGTQTVIERFSIVTLQNLSFVSRSTADRKRPGILLAGISESVQGYPALANVVKELEGIRGTRQNSVTLLNSEFQLQNIRKQLEAAPFPFLHFASHGEFTGSSRDNYILTWDGKMTLDHLEKFIRSGEMKKTPVEILSLSACRTAAGDDRATLGLAGLAVKSGARNSIASLWDVEDRSTSDLFIEFYRILAAGEPGDRAESFRKAQLTMRQRYSHPYFWSPFLFIGEWL